MSELTKSLWAGSKFFQVNVEDQIRAVKTIHLSRLPQ